MSSSQDPNKPIGGEHKAVPTEPPSAQDPATAEQDPATAERDPAPAERDPVVAGHPPAPRAGSTSAEHPGPSPSVRIPRTRVGAAWLGIAVAAIILIGLIVFLLQNTVTVQVVFLGMDGRLPLAVALLIALVSGILLTLIVGTARIGQLRRLARKRKQVPPAPSS